MRMMMSSVTWSMAAAGIPKLFAMIANAIGFAVGRPRVARDRSRVGERPGLRADIAFGRRALQSIGERPVPAGDRQRRFKRLLQARFVIDVREDGDQRLRSHQVVARQSGPVGENQVSRRHAP